MGIRSLLFGLACVFLALHSAPVAAADKWLKAETKHFVIYSAGSQQQLELFARKIEKFDLLLRSVTNTPADEQPLKLPIYVLASSESVGALTGDKAVAGFYRTSPYGSFAVANRERGNDKYDLRGDAVLQHEYVHHFMLRNFAFAYPAWYVEGFAEYFATAEFAEDGSWNRGKPPLYRAYGLILGRDLPIDRLLFGRPGELSRELREVYYGRAWLLTHMLNSDKEGSSQLDAYLNALGRGVPEREAAKGFGDLDALDKRLDRYLAKPLTIRRGVTPITYAGPLTVSALDTFDSKLVDLSLRRRAGNDLARTRDELRALSSVAPDRAQVWLELGLAEKALADEASDAAIKRAHWGAAEAAVDKALATQPALGRANLLKAEIVMERLDSDNQRSPALWKPVRGFISKANRADPLDPAPLAAWYEMIERQGLEPDKLASDGLAQAFYTQPEVTELRVRYAWDLARQGKYDQAIKVVEFVVRDPHNSGQGAALIDSLRRRQEAAKQTSGDAKGSGN